MEKARGVEMSVKGFCKGKWLFTYVIQIIKELGREIPPSFMGHFLESALVPRIM